MFCHPLLQSKVRSGHDIRIKGQLKLIKVVLYRKTILDNSVERRPRLQLILPSHLTKNVLNGCHNQVGHQGIVRTLTLLRGRYYWPGMHKETTLFVSKCQNCVKRKAIPDVAPYSQLLPASLWDWFTWTFYP